MNPIFTRRYKGGSRPNIMPTSKRQHSYLKSISATGSTSSTSSSGSSVLSNLSLGESLEDPSKGEEISPISEHGNSAFVSLKSKGPRKDGVISPGEEASKSGGGRISAQQFLTNKQNMLANINLTPQENFQRTSSSSSGTSGITPLGMRQSLSSHNIGKTAAAATSSNFPRSPTVHNIGGNMTLWDLENEEEPDNMAELSGKVSPSCEGAVGYAYPSPESLSSSKFAIPNLNQRILKDTLDLKVWRELRRVVNPGHFHDGWKGQGFVFDSNIPFGLVQKRGGPCGVLAVVQSILIRNLLFGSTFSPQVTKHPEGFLEGKLYEITSFLTTGDDDESVIERIQKERVQCLVDAVAEIIWTCAQQRQKEDNQCLEEDCSSIIMLSDQGIQPEVIHVYGRQDLHHFLQNSIHRFDCIALVYSAVLTRGINGVKNDMDFENCSLIGQHGYCSQELINLLSMGEAISNTFDNEIQLDGKTLKGIPAQCDIGLLSLFEHYDSIKVGNFLKCPRYPVWIICSESHFSVLFSCEMSLCKQNDSNTSISSFDLFYYDGLARQEKIIRLSIRLPTTRSGWNKEALNQPSTSSACFGDEELIPPLEKCIRTKWKDADVDWNDSEPIL